VLEAHKIARAKNIGEELSFFAKKVGSNYFLSGRRLGFSPLRDFHALAAPSLPLGLRPRLFFARAFFTRKGE
jgi:hypothetical protein